MEVEKTAQERFDDFVKENKLELTSKFIPFSASRSGNLVDLDNKKLNLSTQSSLTLNWIVTVKNDKQKLTTEYSKGIGHLDYDWLNSFIRPTKILVSDLNKINHYMIEAVEHGRVSSLGNQILGHNSKKIEFPTPQIEEVLSSLVLDSNVLDYAIYEDWASDFGYDKDSRAGEKIYNDCRKIASDFIKVIGSKAKLDQLSEIIYDLENEPTQKKTSTSKL